MRKSLPIAIGMLAVTMFAKPCDASTLTFDFATQFSNGTLPGGPAPWVRATFNDTTAAAGFDVRLTINTGGLSLQEFITETDFSINPAINPLSVTANVVSGTNGALTNADIHFGTDAFQADGDGKYDVTLGFSSNPPRATSGNTYVIDFNLTTGTLHAGDFNFLASPGGGNGPFFAAAHLQGIAPNGSQSTWIADSTAPCPDCVINPVIGGSVPEPGSLFLLGSGLLGLARYTRKRLV